MNKLLFAAICSMAMLAGCQQAEEIVNPGEELPMSIEASIGKSDVVTGRYAGETPNNVSFKNGDVIGLLVNNGNFTQWTYNSNIWSQTGSSTVNWNNKKDDHTFYAFYPHTDNATLTEIEMPKLSGQDGSMASVASRDFLYTTKTQSYGTDGKVSFTGEHAFTHISSLLAITIKGDGDLAAATIENITIEGTDILTQSTFSFNPDEEGINPEVILSTEEDKKGNLLTATLSHPINSSDKTFYFIVNAETVNLSDVKLSIAYSFSNGDNYKAEVTGLNNTVNDQFISGKQYAYTLKIQDRILIISGSGIKDWGNGESLGEIIINGTKQEESGNENA